MRCLLLLMAMIGGSGCFTARYLLQAASGQYELLHVARPLSAVKEDPTVPPRIRALLSKVPAIKRYGQLNGLTPTGNYERYADLHRPAAVWVVQGCKSLSFEPKRWAFPIVGTVPYLGFFNPEAARSFAADLAKEERDLDVTVRTASAYSTLGWFKDPVLSTMIPEGPGAFGELANVILHESVHATIYVKNQSAFDESLASFVADELTWLLVVGRSGLQSEEAKAMIEGDERGARFVKEMHLAYEALDAIYRSARSDAEKRALKEARLAELQQTLGLRRRFNNADLAGSRTYDTGRPAFERLRRACGGLPKFLAAVRSLEEKDFQAPQQSDFDLVIDRLTERTCAE
ncbi:MAG: aminopeptidase [Archangium sp.]|nr:aminopeptidase [Archangium sp.]MDP3572736.1 aminopeptidase [Archangium sp.]